MKKNIICLFILGMLFLVSCKEKVKYDKGLDRKVERLKRIDAIKLSERNGIKWGPIDTPEIYFYTGEEIPPSQYQWVLNKNEYQPVFYVDAIDKLKIVVMEPLNTDSQKMTKKLNRKGGLRLVKLPSFSLKDINGKVYQTNSLKGKIVVLNFWFIACPPCREEIPLLNRLVENFNDDDVVFISISDDHPDRLRKFLKKYPLDYVIATDSRIAHQFGISSYPTNVIIDKESNIVFFESGGRDDIDSIMATIIKRLQEK